MKREQGITLISLVVTIIILIILAGVSINLILGQNGIINKAKEAKENMEFAQIEEQKQLNTLYDQMVGQSSGSISNDEISKLIEFKREIANAITDMGIKTSEDADASTMASNIRSIVGTSNQSSGLEVYGHVKNLYKMNSQTMTFTIPKDCNINIFGVFNCDANSSYSSNAILVYLNDTRILSDTSSGINRGYIVYGNNISVKANDVIKVTFNTDYTHYNSFIIYESPNNIVNILDNDLLSNDNSYTAPSNGYYIVTNGGASSGNYPGDYIPSVYINDQLTMQGTYDVAGYGNLVDYIYVKKGDVIRYTSSSTHCTIHKTILNFIPTE